MNRQRPSRTECRCIQCGGTFSIQSAKLKNRPCTFCSHECRVNWVRDQWLARFKAHIAVGDDCWLWQGTIHHSGYGLFSKHGKNMLAHRLSYETFVGPIPDGLDVLHSCDTPACVNPAHLSVGSHQQNMSECKDRGRRPRGEEMWNALLTEEQVRYIRSCSESNHALAALYGVEVYIIRRVRRRETWKHIE